MVVPVSLPRVLLLRQNDGLKSRLGVIRCFDPEGVLIEQFFSLERPWLNNARMVSCIPAGTYTCVPRFSQKFKNHFWVLDVPNRSMILIHIGNFVRDSNGCILVGLGVNRTDLSFVPSLIQSRRAMNFLLANYPKGFILVIV